MSIDQGEGFATLVLTSCNRPVELAQTLKSIMQRDLTGVARMIIIEDSDNQNIGGLVAGIVGDFPHLFLQNSENLGQIRSIDRAYEHVDTPYIYHCEEDWLFPTSLYIEEGRQLLDADQSIVTVVARDLREYPTERLLPAETTPTGVTIRRENPKWSWKWGGFSFNPGMRRTSDYRALGSYASVGPEYEISIHYKYRGRGIVFLDAGDVQHIGHSSTDKPDERRNRQSLKFVLKKGLRKLQFAWFCLRN